MFSRKKKLPFVGLVWFLKKIGSWVKRKMNQNWCKLYQKENRKCERSHWEIEVHMHFMFAIFSFLVGSSTSCFPFDLSFPAAVSWDFVPWSLFLNVTNCMVSVLHLGFLNEAVDSYTLWTILLFIFRSFSNEGRSNAECLSTCKLFRQLHFFCPQLLTHRAELKDYKSFHGKEKDSSWWISLMNWSWKRSIWITTNIRTD